MINLELPNVLFIGKQLVVVSTANAMLTEDQQQLDAIVSSRNESDLKNNTTTFYWQLRNEKRQMYMGWLVAANEMIEDEFLMMFIKQVIQNHITRTK